MAKVKVLRIVMWTMIALTAVLLCTNYATIGILLMAVDVVVAIVYEMQRSACDRRQMHHISLTHRM